MFKRLTAATATVMTTLRAYAGTREEFEARRDALGKAVEEAGFRVERLITEFSIFDSRSGHDARWLAAS